MEPKAICRIERETWEVAHETANAVFVLERGFQRASTDVLLRAAGYSRTNLEATRYFSRTTTTKIKYKELFFTTIMRRFVSEFFPGPAARIAVFQHCSRASLLARRAAPPRVSRTTPNFLLAHQQQQRAVTSSAPPTTAPPTATTTATATSTTSTNSNHKRRGVVYRVVEAKGYGFIAPEVLLGTAQGGAGNSMKSPKMKDNVYFNLSECVGRKVRVDDAVTYEEAPNARFGMPNVAVNVEGGSGGEFLEKTLAARAEKKRALIAEGGGAGGDGELSEAKRFQLGRAALLADITSGDFADGGGGGKKRTSKNQMPAKRKLKLSAGAGDRDGGSKKTPVEK